MPEKTANCRVCGCELEGRDVYEGICLSCREAEILGGRATPRKPRRPDPPPAPAGPVVEEVAPPQKAGVDMDADTKELIALAGHEPPPDPEPPQPPPAPRHRETTILFAELGPPTPEANHKTDAPSPADETPAPSLRFDQELELPVTELDETVVDDAEIEVVGEPPRQDAVVREDTPPPRDEPSSESAMVLPNSLSFAGHEPAAPPKPPEEPEPASEPDEPEDGASLAFHPEHEGEGVPTSAASRPATRDPDMPVVTLKADPELDARLGRLETQIMELAERLKNLRPAAAPGQQIKRGMHVMFGMAIGLVVVAAVAAGLLALVGSLFYPPALDLLRRAAALVSGG